MEAAGATVLTMEHFGSYQGDWWAKVLYNGTTGWVHGCFGSCSGCDAFEAEFGWHDEDKPDYQQRLSDFGKLYLNDLYTQKEAEKIASRASNWDHEAEHMLKFIKDNKI